MVREQDQMEVLEISFREWVLCKVGRICQVSQQQPVAEPKPVPSRVFNERSGRERRVEKPDKVHRGKEWRRTPDRRLPEVGECSLEEFNRWKK
ncbi:MAG TPA: hypothetical protein VF096_04270 [Azonexus sp.]